MVCLLCFFFAAMLHMCADFKSASTMNGIPMHLQRPKNKFNHCLKVISIMPWDQYSLSWGVEVNFLRLVITFMFYSTYSSPGFVFLERFPFSCQPPWPQLRTEIIHLQGCGDLAPVLFHVGAALDCYNFRYLKRGFGCDVVWLLVRLFNAFPYDLVQSRQILMLRAILLRVLCKFWVCLPWHSCF